MNILSRYSSSGGSRCRHPRRSETARTGRPLLSASDAARAAVARLRTELGPQVLLLAPDSVGWQALADFAQEDWDAIVGHIVGCPVYLDIREHLRDNRAGYRLDVAPTPGSGQLGLTVRRVEEVQPAAG